MPTEKYAGWVDSAFWAGVSDNQPWMAKITAVHAMILFLVKMAAMGIVLDKVLWTSCPSFPVFAGSE